MLLAIDAIDYPVWFILVFVFLFGTVFGSFLNVCIHRFPKHDRLKDQLTGIWGRSNCPRCKEEILARDNIPILGWLMLGGKCRNCKLSISARYPMIELCNGLLWVLVYMFELPEGWGTLLIEQCCYAGPRSVTDMTQHLGPQILEFNTFGTDALTWMHLRYLFHMVLIQSLVVATFIDFDLQIIPDGSTVPAMIFALIASTVIGQVFLVPIWFDDPSNRQMIASMLPGAMQWLAFDFNGVQFARNHPHWHGLLVSLAGLIVGGGSIWAVRIIGFKALRKEAMGFGDVVLMAAIGSFIGWQPVLIVFFLAAMCAMCAVIVGLLFRRQSEIPYGPYISLGTLLLILYWDKIWPYGKSYFDLGIGLLFVGIIMAVSLFVSLLLMRLIKRLLGIDDYNDDVGEWNHADSMLHYAGERIDEQQGQWKRKQWEGSLSGRGLRQNDVWRNGE